MPSNIVVQCSDALVKKKLTIAFVESCTAGRLTSEFSLVPESGQILLGGMVCYNVQFKENLLDIPSELIEEFTAESAEVTHALAQSFGRISGSDICVAVTGLVSPGGSETPEKPVGTIFIHIIMPHKFMAYRVQLNGSPEEIVVKAVDKVAEILLSELQNLPQS